MIATLKIVFLTEMDGYQDICDTNKNATKMGMIIKRVYCIMILTRMGKIHCRKSPVHRELGELPTPAKKTHPPTTESYRSVVGSTASFLGHPCADSMVGTPNFIKPFKEMTFFLWMFEELLHHVLHSSQPWCRRLFQNSLSKLTVVPLTSIKD